MTEAASLLVVLIFGALSFLIVRKRQPLGLNVEVFNAKWHDLQKMCSNKKSWKEAIGNADELLDEALRKKHIRGRSMGERLVHAQRLFTDNDGVWFGHKLSGRIEAEPKLKLKETDVKEALIGIRQGLKDLGALPEAKKAGEK